QSGDAGKKIVSALLRHWLGAIAGFTKGGDRGPDIDGHALNRVLKSFRHDADDLEGTAIERDAAAGDRGIAAEMAFPKMVTQDDHVISRFVFFVGKISA